MGRAKNNSQAVALSGFDELLGSRRGGRNDADMASSNPSARAREFADELSEQAYDGDIGPAISALIRDGAQAGTLPSRPLHSQLADAVCKGAARAALLSRDERGALLDRLGLAREPHPEYIEALALKSVQAARDQLPDALAHRDSDPGPLIAAARGPEMRSFAGKVADRTRCDPAAELLALYDPAEIADLAAATGEGSLAADTLAAARKLGSLLTDRDWRESILGALGEPRVALADLLRTKLVLASAAAYDDAD